ncbi:NAD(P)/FAD-dependent oxidoreductase [Psychroserpens sp. NJDZ02]|uniref:NAD(P)/FAD-dependent oxidoreductase n=1 Tax=Psychroserpens sp. NJDZ02 TaxID=2570561 RepID=UPI0010A804CA|nr:FAD-dependent oxidoreductase [Psychroserpens sp. NJDZ02]QCE40510.1 FAD-dependent oxidoreductase [Psychroserpens sp. NJDZ02]
MKVDYIIVGCGLAGISFCEKLKENNKTFIVFDDNSQQSSVVAGGLYNPVTLKRFTPVWKSEEQLATALPVYSKLEEVLGVNLDYKIPVKRRFTSLEEQNNWFAASDKEGLKPFLNTSLFENTNTNIEASFKLGEVLHTGRLDTKQLIESYKPYLLDKNLLITDPFVHDLIEIKNDQIEYKDISAKQIVFAEGFGIKQNPYFKELPLGGTKGQLLTIHAPDLKLDYVLKSSVFVIPLGQDTYRVGSTYEQKDKTNTITEEARQMLLDKLKTFVKCDFEVLSQVAGVRPTVKDRKPLVGRHPISKNIYLFNGLGSRGVMIAPYMANQLFNFIENNGVLDKEIDCLRFF